MSKSKRSIIQDIAWCATEVHSDNMVDVTFVGQNTKGANVRVVLERQPTYILSHIADEIAQAMVRVRGRVQNDINSVKQSLE